MTSFVWHLYPAALHLYFNASTIFMLHLHKFIMYTSVFSSVSDSVQNSNVFCFFVLFYEIWIVHIRNTNSVKIVNSSLLSLTNRDLAMNWSVWYRKKLWCTTEVWNQCNKNPNRDRHSSISHWTLRFDGTELVKFIYL